MTNYFVYILYSQSRKLFYVGMTTIVESRINQHNSGESSFTSTGIPWEILWCTVKESKSAAQILELKIKNLSAKKKLVFMEKYSIDLVNKDLFYKIY